MYCWTTLSGALFFSPGDMPVDIHWKCTSGTIFHLLDGGGLDSCAPCKTHHSQHSLERRPHAPLSQWWVCQSQNGISLSCVQIKGNHMSHFRDVSYCLSLFFLIFQWRHQRSVAVRNLWQPVRLPKRMQHWLSTHMMKCLSKSTLYPKLRGLFAFDCHCLQCEISILKM